jgi:hypothetical protein
MHRLISPQEKLLMIARPHWIYVLQGIVWIILLYGVGYAIDHYLALHLADSCQQIYVNLGFAEFSHSPFCTQWILAAIGAALLWVFTVSYLSFEIGLTNQRVIYKKGLVFIEVDQVGIEDIHGEQVYHGLFGWLLGYGRVKLECRYVGNIWLPAINKPYKLIKALHVARMNHEHIKYDHHDLTHNLDMIEAKERNGSRPVMMFAHRDKRDA